jgi:chemotaxis protein histidine kinase CheA
LQLYVPVIERELNQWNGVVRFGALHKAFRNKNLDYQTLVRSRQVSDLIDLLLPYLDIHMDMNANGGQICWRDKAAAIAAATAAAATEAVGAEVIAAESAQTTATSPEAVTEATVETAPETAAETAETADSLAEVEAAEGNVLLAATLPPVPSTSDNAPIGAVYESSSEAVAELVAEAVEAVEVTETVEAAETVETLETVVAETVEATEATAAEAAPEPVPEPAAEAVVVVVEEAAAAEDTTASPRPRAPRRRYGAPKKPRS